MICISCYINKIANKHPVAAADTTGNAMTVAAFNVLYNPNIRKQVVAELTTKYPDQTSNLSFVELEKLPYLVSISPHLASTEKEEVYHMKVKPELPHLHQKNQLFPGEKVKCVEFGMEYLTHYFPCFHRHSHKWDLKCTQGVPHK